MTALVSDVVRVDWYILGVYLGVKLHILEEIREDHSISTRRCKLNMLKAWLRSSEEPCTKQKLMTALWYITHHALLDSSECYTTMTVIILF